MKYTREIKALMKLLILGLTTILLFSCIFIYLIIHILMELKNIMKKINFFTDFILQ